MKPVKPKKYSPEQEKIIAAFKPMAEWMANRAMQINSSPDYIRGIQQQFENLMRAGLFLQPKQLEFCLRARECDIPYLDIPCDECKEGLDKNGCKCEKCGGVGKMPGPTAVMSAGGRGSGKSDGIIKQIFADDCQRFPGLKVLFVRKIGKAGQEQIQDFRTKVLAHLPHEYKQQAQEIHFANGSKVIMGNFKDEKDLDRYMGLEFDIIYCMETNQLTFAKKKFLLTCLRTSKQGWRPRLYEDTNPGGTGMAENKQMYVIPNRQNQELSTGTRYIHSTVYDNAFVNKEYIKQLESLQGWQRKAWLDGDWDFAAGSYFTNFSPKIHVLDEFNEKNAVRWFVGYDYGMSHCAAWVLACQDKAGNTYIIDEWCENDTIIDLQGKALIEMLENHHLKPNDLDYISAGRDVFSRDRDGKTIADDLYRVGIDLVDGEVDRINGFKLFHSLFGDSEIGIAPRLFIHKRCPKLIAQIQVAQHSEKRPGDVEKFNASQDGEGGDDLLDATKTMLASDPNRAVKYARPVAISKNPYICMGLGM